MRSRRKKDMTKESSKNGVEPGVRQEFTREFKLLAVERLKRKEMTATALADELGVRRNQLYKWAKEVETKGAEAAFRNSVGRKAGSEESEIARLRRQLARSQEEVAILKKFNACFGQLKKSTRG